MAGNDAVCGQAGCCVWCRGDVAAEPARLGSLLSGHWQNRPTRCFGDLRSPVLIFPPSPAPHPISVLILSVSGCLKLFSRVGCQAGCGLKRKLLTHHWHVAHRESLQERWELWREAAGSSLELAEGWEPQE